MSDKNRNGGAKRPPPRERLAALRQFVVHSKLEPDAFLTEYRSRGYQMYLRNHEHPIRALQAAAVVLAPLGMPTLAQVHAALGGPGCWLKRSRKAIHTLIHELHGPRGHPDASGQIDRWLTEALGPLPETWLDPDIGTLVSAPSNRSARRVSALRCEAVRITAAFALALSVARGDTYACENNLLRAYDALDKVLATGSDRDRAWLFQRLEAFLQNPEISKDKRLQFWQAWLRWGKLLDTYCSGHAAVGARYAQWRIELPECFFTPDVRRLKVQISQAKAGRRTKSCSLVADAYPVILGCYDNRFREIEAIRTAFDQICNAIRSGETPMPAGRHRFSVTLPRTHADGTLAQGERTLDFAVTTPRYLERHYCTPPRQRRRWPDPEALLLEYLGARDETGIPILEMYRTGSFIAPRHLTSTQLAQRERLFPSDTWPQSHAVLTLLRPANKAISRVTNSYFACGVVLIPIAELHFAFAVGRALARCCLHGARIGEAIQQVWEPGSFQSVVDQGCQLYTYNAVAKCCREPEPYSISGADFDAVAKALEVSRANGWDLKIVDPPDALKHKCGPARYIYQRNGARPNSGALCLTVSLPLWPRVIHSHDLRHGMARFLRHTGFSEETIAAFLHHKDGSYGQNAPARIGTPRTVQQYCTPTPAMLREIWKTVNAAEEARP